MSSDNQDTLTILSTDRGSIRIAKEESFAKLGDSPKFEILRILRESLALKRETLRSKEITGNRQIQSLASLGESVEGEIDCELSHKTFDSLLSALLGSQWSELEQKDSFSVTAVDSKIQGTKTLPDTLGDFVRIKGFQNTENNGVFAIQSKTENAIILRDATLKDESNQLATLNTFRLQDGTDAISFFLEKQFSDLTEVHQVTGLMVAESRLSLSFDSPVSIQFSMMGQGLSVQSQAKSQKSNTNELSKSPIFTAPTSVGKFLVYRDQRKTILDDAPIQSLSIQISNNLRKQSALNERQAVGYGSGKFLVTGEMSFFYGSSLFASVMNEEDLALELWLMDPLGGHFILILPRIRFTEASALLDGENRDMVLSTRYQALSYTKNETVPYTLELHSL